MSYNKNLQSPKISLTTYSALSTNLNLLFSNRNKMIDDFLLTCFKRLLQ